MTGVEIVTLVVAFLGTSAGAALTKALFSWLGSMAQTEKQAQMLSYARLVVGAVEEYASRPDIQLKGQQKLEEGVKRLQQRYPSLPAAEARTLLEGILGATEVDRAGAATKAR